MKEDHPTSLFNLNERLYLKKVDPSDNSTHACSDCLALTEFVRLGEPVFTAISRKVVGKNVHSTILKGDMGYDQYSFPDTVAVKPTFVAFL